ncbi:MAG: DUF1385 domain-containing protein [Clostridiales bacterium]|nr:DUF1385 domain-containing protein [Clostridiales bacterium]
MDLKRIFIKDACPTKTGGQAVLNGIMMKGPEKTAVAVRLPDETMHIKIEENKPQMKIAKVPFVRGVFVFVNSLVQGTRILTYSADVLETFEREHPGFYEEKESAAAEADGDGGQSAVREAAAALTEEKKEEGGFYGWLVRRFGEKGAWNFALAMSVIGAILATVLIFIIAPTIVVNLLKHVTENEIILNLTEGVLRILMFIGYVVLIARMEEIKDVFRYHGAEHKTIHCYENGLELTPANAQQFYTLHPRCGTSFLMFVLVISLILFSLLGWPNLFWRIVSRLLLLPVIAGLSFELLRWAGRSDNIVVKILSIPGLLLQKLTTNEPTDSHLEVAIAAMKAVLSEDGQTGEGLCDKDGRIYEPHVIKEPA